MAAGRDVTPGLGGGGSARAHGGAAGAWPGGAGRGSGRRCWAVRAGRMLSRLQELRKEEETLLRVKAALHDQLTRLKVEELALQSMIRSREEDAAVPPAAAAESQETLGQMDNEAAINQTELQLSLQDHEEEEEEEEESDS